MKEDQKQWIEAYQRAWLAALRTLEQAIDDGEGHAPDDVVAVENEAHDIYRQACNEAGICLRVDCYTMAASASSSRRDVLCVAHAREWDELQRKGEV